MKYYSSHVWSACKPRLCFDVAVVPGLFLTRIWHHWWTNGGMKIVWPVMIVAWNWHKPVTQGMGSFIARTIFTSEWIFRMIFHSCFSFVIFCRRFAPRCSGCFGILKHDDMIRRAKDHFFHIDCFVCVVCHRQLMTGDEFVIINGHLFICQEDYQHLQQSSAENQGSTRNNSSFSSSNCLPRS